MCTSSYELRHLPLEKRVNDELDREPRRWSGGCHYSARRRGKTFEFNDLGVPFEIIFSVGREEKSNQNQGAPGCKLLVSNSFYCTSCCREGQMVASIASLIGRRARRNCPTPARPADGRARYLVCLLSLAGAASMLCYPIATAFRLLGCRALRT